MQPITPKRFYELIQENNGKPINLWDNNAGKYKLCKYVYPADHLLIVKTDKCLDPLLRDVYESKPRTAYDDITESKSLVNVQNMIDLYQSELESIPSKMEDK
jgi:hypothetical protein